jgi:hypothetical protein
VLRTFCLARRFAMDVLSPDVLSSEDVLLVNRLGEMLPDSGFSSAEVMRQAWRQAWKQAWRQPVRMRRPWLFLDRGGRLAEAENE